MYYPLTQDDVDNITQGVKLDTIVNSDNLDLLEPCNYVKAHMITQLELITEGRDIQNVLKTSLAQIVLQGFYFGYRKAVEDAQKYDHMLKDAN